MPIKKSRGTHTHITLTQMANSASVHIQGDAGQMLLSVIGSSIQASGDAIDVPWGNSDKLVNANIPILKNALQSYIDAKPISCIDVSDYPAVVIEARGSYASWKQERDIASRLLSDGIPRRATYSLIDEVLLNRSCSGGPVDSYHVAFGVQLFDKTRALPEISFETPDRELAIEATDTPHVFHVLFGTNLSAEQFLSLLSDTPLLPLPLQRSNFPPSQADALQKLEQQCIVKLF